MKTFYVKKSDAYPDISVNLHDLTTLVQGYERLLDSDHSRKQADILSLLSSDKPQIKEAVRQTVEFMEDITLSFHPLATIYKLEEYQKAITSRYGVDKRQGRIHKIAGEIARLVKAKNISLENVENNLLADYYVTHPEMAEDGVESEYELNLGALVYIVDEKILEIDKKKGHCNE